MNLSPVQLVTVTTWRAAHALLRQTTNKLQKLLTGKTSMAISKLHRRKRAEATSLPSVFLFFEVFRKSSSEISNNSRLRQLRRGKQQRFQPSSCPKTVIRAAYFHLIPSPTCEFPVAGEGANGIWGFCMGVRRGFFWKYVKNVKDFQCRVKAMGYNSVQSEHPVATAAIYPREGNKRPNVTSRNGILPKT